MVIHAPTSFFQWCQGINNLTAVWETSEGECVVMMETVFSKVYNKIDLMLLNRSPHSIMYHNLTDYISAKNNTVLTYKDTALSSMVYNSLRSSAPNYKSRLVRVEPLKPTQHTTTMGINGLWTVSQLCPLQGARR